MPALRGITVAVGEWYARTLEVCLVRNMRHLTECLVVTAPGDPCAEVARAVPGASVFETDAFTRHGAMFNKGLGMTEGFQVLGRDGWVAVLDADILLPDSLTLDHLSVGHLYGARRRVLEDPSQWTPELDWRRCPMLRDGGPIGFAQIFNCDDPAIKDKAVWYDVSFGHAGGSDAAFMSHWPRNKWVVLPVDCLHLGPVDRNWFGCDPAGRDMMARFVTENGWRRAAQGLGPAAALRAPEPVHRVEVPGYEPSDFELPFVRRARARP